MDTANEAEMQMIASVDNDTLVTKMTADTIKELRSAVADGVSLRVGPYSARLVVERIDALESALRELYECQHVDDIGRGCRAMQRAHELLYCSDTDAAVLKGGA